MDRTVLKSFVLTFVGLLATAGSTFAAIYEFGGTITEFSDPHGLMTAEGLALDGPFSFRVRLDFGMDGAFTQNRGATITKIDTPTEDWFFADYLGGDALSIPVSAAFTSPGHVAEYNHAFDDLAGGDSIVTMNSENNVLEMTVPSGSIRDLAVGDSVRIDNRISYRDRGRKTAFWVSNDATLKSITRHVNPEPTSLAVWCVLGAAGIGRRWRSHNRAS